MPTSSEVDMPNDTITWTVQQQTAQVVPDEWFPIDHAAVPAPVEDLLQHVTPKDQPTRQITDESWFMLNRMVPDLPEELPVMDWFVTGSAYICDPPCTTTDLDIAIRIPHFRLPKAADIVGKFKELGWQMEGEYEGTGFTSLRKDLYNVILISAGTTYESLKLYTQVAKVLNVQDKAKRIMLAKAIRDAIFLYEPEKYAKKVPSDHA